VILTPSDFQTSVEVNAPFSGTIVELLVSDGEKVVAKQKLYKLQKGEGGGAAPKQEEPKQEEPKQEKKPEPKREEKPASPKPQPEQKKPAAEQKKAGRKINLHVFNSTTLFSNSRCFASGSSDSIKAVEFYARC
jgi:2-oxoglutarate dehydrogenase E2 component (dihydrolipoamide succinyltransferase)